jgi:hypothetical protein
MKELIYAEVDLPQIPNDVIDIEFSYRFNLNIKYPGADLQLVKNNEPIIPCKYTVGMIDKSLKDWLNFNLPWAKTLLKKIQIAESDDSIKAVHSVHTDIKRCWALNYMFELGGEDVWTSWYKEKNKPLHRFRDSETFQADNKIVKYENLDAICSTKLKNFKWYLIRVDILHDVSQIENRRSSLTISIEDENLPIEVSDKILNPKYYVE